MLGLNTNDIHAGMGLIAMAQVGLLAGMGGSFHCVGMCGGMAIASGRTLKDASFYQIGRLIGYLFLAFVVGMTGKQAQAFLDPKLQTALGIFLGLMLMVMGIFTLRGVPMHLPGPMARAQAKFSSLLPRGSFFVGLGSIFLPCGLLYSVLAALLVLQDPWMAMAFMALFWAGSVPALALLPHSLRRAIEKLGMKWSSLNGWMFIAFGLTSIAIKLWPATGAAGHTCH